MDYNDVTMYEINVNSLVVEQVNLYEFYISKSNSGKHALFQTQKRVYDADGRWSKCEPLAKNVTTKNDPVIPRKAGLSQIYTNHYVRAATTTTHHKAGKNTMRGKEKILLPQRKHKVLSLDFATKSHERTLCLESFALLRMDNRT